MAVKLPFFSRKAAPPPQERKSAVLGLNDTLSKLLLMGSGNGDTAASAIELYNSSSAVSIPVNKIAEAFASLTLVLKEDGEVEREHPVLERLRQPSPFMSGELFLEALAKYFLVAGDVPVVATGTVTRPPLELWAPSPSKVSVTEGEGGVAGRYILSSGVMSGTYVLNMDRGRARYYDGTLRELRLIRGFNPADSSMLRGQSPLKAAGREVRQHILGNQHNVSLLERGGRVSLVFHFEDDMSDDDFEAVKARVRAQYGGAQNAGEIGVTAGGKLDIKEAGVSNKDMDFANLQRVARDAVALQYKVPLPLLSTDAATFNNYREAKLALYDDAVLPLADRLLGALSAFLLPRYGLDPSRVRITYDHDNITALATRRNEELKLRRDLNLETTNELRGMLGREPVEGGDVVLAPANLIPVGTDLFTADQPQRTVVYNDADEDEEEGDDRPDDGGSTDEGTA